MEEEDSWLEDEEVMSEVHVGSDPSSSSGISVFAISPFSAHSEIERNSVQNREGRSVETEEEWKGDDQVCNEEHGDLILPRRRRSRRRPDIDEGTEDCIRVNHHDVLVCRALSLLKGRPVELCTKDDILHKLFTELATRYQGRC